MTRTLRGYQQDARSDIQAEWAAGITRTAIVLPTGSGKTDVIAKVCLDEVATGNKVLILVHRSELADQLIERIECYSSIPVGRLQGNHNRLGRSIIVATVQTLRQPKRRQALSATDWQPNLVVIDECQHSMSDSYLDITEWAGCFDDRKTKLLGVTATLIRGDGQSFDGLFETVANTISYDWAFDQKLLVEPVIKRIKLDRFWDRYRPITADKLMERDAQRTVKGWQRKAQNRVTIAYETNRESAHYLTEAFLDAGISAALVIGTTPYKDRTPIYEALAAGEIRVMVNVDVATEGFDCPEVSCILLARVTHSASRFIQMVGRGLRPDVNPITGKEKTDCLILDTTGMAREFDLETLVDIDPSCIRNTEQPSRLQKLWDSFRHHRLVRSQQ